ncbi:MAG: hypothetical protein J6U86_03150 [Clostridia bacterium]|nr:hypothetical protein [Clostridia bacterium]
MPLPYINIEEIEGSAKLSLSREERQEFSEELLRFAEFANILGEFCDSDPLEIRREDNTLVAREDIPAERHCSAREILGDERVVNGYIRVPLTVEEEQ